MSKKRIAEIKEQIATLTKREKHFQRELDEWLKHLSVTTMLGYTEDIKKNAYEVQTCKAILMRITDDRRNLIDELIKLQGEQNDTE